MTQQLILSIDLGTSSVRCSLYTTSNSNEEPIQLFGDASSLSWEAVHPETGKIRLHQFGDDETNVTLLDLVDQCIDKTLAKLQQSSSSSDDVEIVAVGFSSLVMNLIGVDADGTPVGEEATLSYACNLPPVAAKVKELQR